jgi:hypothetical protein
MRERVDEAAIDKRQPITAERGGDRKAVGAVAVEQAGRRAVENDILAVKQRNRNRFAIGGRSE